MNVTLKKIINSYCHRKGLEHGLDLRDSLIARARIMWKEGKSPSEIAKALGIEVRPGVLDTDGCVISSAVSDIDRP